MLLHYPHLRTFNVTVIYYNSCYSVVLKLYRETYFKDYVIHGVRKSPCAI